MRSAVPAMDLFVPNWLPAVYAGKISWKRLIEIARDQRFELVRIGI